MKRRTILLAGLGGFGALLVGWGAWPASSRLRGEKPLPTAPGEVALNGWVKISADDAVTIIVPRCEMGQGVHTGLAMLLAEELDCDWSRVRVEAAPIDPIYRNHLVTQRSLPFGTDEHGSVTRLGEHFGNKLTRLVGFMITGGSTSIPELWLPLRQAGATGRATLVAIAARRWQVPTSELSVTAGVVSHPRHGALGFGALVAAAGPDLPAIASATLKSPAAFAFIGRPLLRLDGAEKVDGRALFASDVREPDMLFAALAMAPRRDDTLESLTDAAARGLPGVRGVVRVPAFRGYAPAVAVLADSSWQASRAVEALRPVWVRSVGPQANDAALSAALWEAVRDSREGHVFRDRGDVTRDLVSPDPAARAITAEYEQPFLAHAAMEPMSCTVKVERDRAVVYAGTQSPDAARAVVAEMLNMDEEAVEIRFVSLGGSFGRRTELDVILQAVSIAREFPGRLVQLQWTREDDLRNDCYRPAAVARLEGSVAHGRIRAWHARSACQSANNQVARRLLDMPPTGPDKGVVEGAHDLPYDIASLRVENVLVSLPVMVGVWRSVGYSYQTFCTESFVDELAHEAGADPVRFRLMHLGRAPREAAVLRLAADKSGWSAAPAPVADGARVARGVALCRSFGSAVGQVLEVSMSPEGRPRVHRVVAAIDCGTAVNPNLVRQQVEGSVIFGLSAALYGKVSFDDGRVREGNFDSYRVMRLPEAPMIEVYIVDSRAAPTGVGETGVPAVAPALANGLFALTGQRTRRLPIVPS